MRGAADRGLCSPRRFATAGRPRAGHTFFEVLTVIIVVGILVSLLLPAINAAREAARRITCANQLSQLALAVQQYESAFGVFPPGTVESRGPILSVPQGYHHSWISQVLPYLEQRVAYLHLDRSVGVYHARNRPVRQHAVEVLRCPTSGYKGRGYSDYAGVHNDFETPIDVDNHGVFFLNSQIRYDDILDGTSQTMLIGEKITIRGDLGWISGTRATLRNTGVPLNLGGALFTSNRLPPAGTLDTEPRAKDEVMSDLFGGALDPASVADRWRFYRRELRADELPRFTVPKDVRLAVGGFGSNHPGGVQFAFADGSVRFIASQLDVRTFVRYAHRADRGVIDDDSG